MAIFDTKNDVFELIEKFDKSSIAELELSSGDLSVKLSKQNKIGSYISEIQNIPVISAVKEEKLVEISKSPDMRNDAKIIKAPLIGTFYSAPSPDSEPYVKIGDRISKGAVICIIEAMKIMNEIESDTDGEIVEVLAASGTPVEFGQALFRLR